MPTNNASFPCDALEITGFPDYWISPAGEVYSGRSQRLLKPTLMPHKYFSVTLADGRGGNQRFSVAQLVGQMFVPNPQELPYAVPADGDFHNYTAANLRWARSYSPPNPPASVEPGEQRRVTTLAQLLVLWERYELLLQNAATLSAPGGMTAGSLWCSLTDPLERTLDVHVRNRAAAQVLNALLTSQGRATGSGPAAGPSSLTRKELERWLDNAK